MGLFERFKKNSVNQTDVSYASERLPKDEQMPLEITPNQRQQEKIIAALSGDVNALGQREVVIDDRQKEDFFDKIANGEITLEDKKQLLGSIVGPKHKYGAMSVYTGFAVGKNGRAESIRGISDRDHMLKLVAVFSGRGFEKFNEVEAVDIANFWRRFETPADFEPEARSFLEMIKQANSLQKYQEYKGYMREFQYTMFGKQQEYWEQMQLLEKEAKNRQRKKATRLMSEVAIGMVETEPIVKATGLAEISKTQVVQGDFERLEIDETSQDASLLMSEKGIFGVFDGVGGSVGGRLASSSAASEVARLSEEKEVENALDLKDMLNSASEVVNKTAGTGSTTGTLIKIKELEGKKVLMWVSVGDSRLYIVNKNNEVQQISKDEGFENKITNALGGGLEGDRVKQGGTINLSEGDRLVLCTDGITGDKGTDLMSDDELGNIVGRANSVEEAAENLVRGARKRDDRTAIVIQV